MIEPPRTAQFRFLGGPADYSITYLAITGAFAVPPEEHIWHTKHEGTVRYVRHRVSNGTRSWFVFIAEGHNPTPAQLADANPYPI